MTRPAGPVVAGTAGGRLGTVAGPGTGRLVPPRPEAPARAVAGPAADPAPREGCGTAGRGSPRPPGWRTSGSSTRNPPPPAGPRAGDVRTPKGGAGPAAVLAEAVRPNRMTAHPHPVLDTARPHRRSPTGVLYRFRRPAPTRIADRGGRLAALGDDHDYGSGPAHARRTIARGRPGPRMRALTGPGPNPPSGAAHETLRGGAAVSTPLARRAAATPGRAS